MNFIFSKSSGDIASATCMRRSLNGLTGTGMFSFLSKVVEVVFEDDATDYLNSVILLRTLSFSSVHILTIFSSSSIISMSIIPLPINVCSRPIFDSFSFSFFERIPSYQNFIFIMSRSFIFSARYTRRS